jgi:hypothetical protein
MSSSFYFYVYVYQRTWLLRSLPRWLNGRAIWEIAMTRRAMMSGIEGVT